MLNTLDIVHGDIKPENVLIFPDGNGSYEAKVTDFGYSTKFASDTESITMPYSPLWTAPEQHHRQVLPAQAKKMDAYSFGMLCQWLIFYNKAGQTRRFEEDLANTHISVLNHVLDLASAISYSDDQTRNDIQDLFKLTLVEDPNERSSDFARFLGLLPSRG